MKITKETKIKDLIPQEYEPTGHEITNAQIADGTEVLKTLMIYIQNRGKTFQQYVDQYLKETMTIDTKQAYDITRMTPENLNMGNKLGLLWYIVKDKKGSLQDLSDLIGLINETRIVPANSIAYKLFGLFPVSFIDAFKKEG